MDILVCLLPNDINHTVVINAKFFLRRPELHFNQVHKEVESRQGKSKVIIRGKKNFFQTTLLTTTLRFINIAILHYAVALWEIVCI